MKKNITKLILGIFLTTSVAGVSAQTTDVKSKELLEAMIKVNGGYNHIAAKKDVQFTYVYDNFEKGKDISLERHIFNGEHSWGSYEQHELNILPKQKGVAIQSLVSGVPALTLDGKKITDKKAIGVTIFLRKVNFYWFTMMYKLMDPGTIYKHLGKETLYGISYDKVSLVYDSGVTKKEKNDEYILYFNPNTHLVDLFFFSLPDWGINDPILKMTLEYAVVDGVYLTPKRKAYAPNKEGEYKIIGEFTFKDIKFNNGFKAEDFKL